MTDTLFAICLVSIYTISYVLKSQHHKKFKIKISLFKKMYVNIRWLNVKNFILMF